MAPESVETCVGLLDASTKDVLFFLQLAEVRPRHTFCSVLRTWILGVMVCLWAPLGVSHIAAAFCSSQRCAPDTPGTYLGTDCV